jgi:poly-gamma-glutamate synthesis protein (capsule biosynthesis protein)
VNLECVIARGGHPWTRWPKVFHFRADPVAVTALQLAGIDCVTLANNHVLDYEEDALLEMLDLLEQRGMAYAGAGRCAEEARRPALLEARGVRVGVVAFTDNEPGWAATPTTPGTNWVPMTLEEPSLAPVRAGLSRARAEGAEVVIVSLHWGPNMVQRPSPLFRAFAHAVIDAGADLLFGHSAHIFQGIEIYRGRPIIYDAGDFVDDYAVDPTLRNDWGLLFRVSVAEAAVRRIELEPVLIENCQVNLARGATHQAIAGRIGTLSAEMGTQVHRHGDQLWIDCAST